MPSIIVPGDPMPMPRARYRVVDIPGRKPFVQTYTPKTADQRKEAVAQAWRFAGHGCYQAEVYVVLWAVFYFPRPKSQLDAHGSVRPRFLRRRPASRGASRNGQRFGGDVDNCLKLVADALSTVAYLDDAQVVRLEGEKRYVDQGQAPGVSQTVIGVDLLPGSSGPDRDAVDALMERDDYRGAAPRPEKGTAPEGAVPEVAGKATDCRSAGNPT